ncbi:MAG TPA: ABC transporter substrate-binding protein [Anaerolineae bacterium]|nr:ABC transporter substrate-binding protein [Anaerolineae bacterium]HIP72227.1 ABC transporter substrate-binding protein [Anaerolineae bacterium]
MLKKFAVLLVLLVLVGVSCQSAEPKDEKVVVGMMTIVSHPSLDAIQQGVKDKLAEAGYVEGENLEIIEGNAEGDMATLNTIAQQFVDEGVDVIVATTTPALQAAYNATKDAENPPIIFNGVSNPYAAGIANAPDDHPAWVLGNQLLDPVAEAMALIKEIKPTTQTLGLIYNPAEANSVYLAELAQDEAGKMGLTLEVATVSNSSELQTAAEALAARGIDAFLAISDNTVTSGFEAIVQVANDNDLLLVGTSASMPPRGAAAAFGIDPYQEGLDSGNLLVSFLKGDLDLASAEIQIQDAVLLTVNPAAAAEQNATLPQELVDKADSIIEE